MVQSNAHRQKQYRQRRAIEELRNDFGVTMMLEQAKRAHIDVWPTLVACANEVFEHNGDGLRFIKNIAVLAYAVLSVSNITQGCRDRP